MRIFAHRAIISVPCSEIVVENFTRMVQNRRGHFVYDLAVLVLKAEHEISLSPLGLWLVTRRGDRKRRTIATLKVIV